MGDVKYRRRGTVILETKQGILVVAGRHRSFMLPGGGANRGESRFVAALRELTEETSLLPYEAKVIFKHLGHPKPTFSGKGQYQDHHTVCVVKATGKIKLRDDAKRLAYIDPNSLKVSDPFNSGRETLISNTTKEIIQKYRDWKSTQQGVATDEDVSEAQDINSSDILPNDDVD